MNETTDAPPLYRDALAALRAEVASLRDENARLRARLSGGLPLFDRRNVCRLCGHPGAIKIVYVPAVAPRPARWWRRGREARPHCIRNMCGFCRGSYLEQTLEHGEEVR